MASLFGHKWTSAYGDEVDVDGMWSRALAGLTEDDLKNGFNRLALEGSDWPPSAPEFRGLCLNMDRNHESDREHRARAAAHAKWLDENPQVLRIEDKTATERRKARGREAMQKIREANKI